MLRLARTLLVLLFLPACHGPAATSDPGKDLTPKGASMVIVAHGDNPNVWEKSFAVHATYPGLGIGDDGFARLRGHGWKRCESRPDAWSNYVDQSRGAPATVYRRNQYWRRGNDLLEIVFSHRVDAGSDPDAALSTQRVTLSFHGAQSAQEIERWNVVLGGSCDG